MCVYAERSLKVECQFYERGEMACRHERALYTRLDVAAAAADAGGSCIIAVRHAKSMSR